MFLSTICRNFVKPFSVPELIVKRFPFHLQKFEYPKHQVEKINDFPKVSVVAALDFPYRSFKLFNNSDLKMIFHEFHHRYFTMDNTNTTDLYHCLLKNYVTYNIDFDANEILKEMVNNKVNINKSIISILLRKYYEDNNLKAATQLIQKCEENETLVTKYTFTYMHLLYLRKKLDQEAANLVEKHDIDTNTSFVLREKATIYMLNDRIDKMQETLKQLQTKSHNHVIGVYERAAENHQPDYILKQILTYASSPSPLAVENGITNLNRNEFYNQAYLLMTTYTTILQSNNNSYILQSFNYSKCPLDTYQSVLKWLFSLNKLHMSFPWFTGFKFEDSLFMAKQLLETKIPGYLIYSNFLMRSIQENNDKQMEKCLEFGYNEIGQTETNFVILNKLPAILRCYESYDKFLTNLQPYKSILLPICLLNLLLEGKTNQFLDLKTKYPTHITQMSISKYVVVKIFNIHNKITYLETFAKHCNTIFTKAFTTTLCRYILSHTLCNPKQDQVDDAIEFIKKYNIENNAALYEKAMNINPNYKLKLEKLYEIAKRNKQQIETLD